MPDEDVVKFFAAVDDALASSVGRLRGSDKLRVSCGSSVAWRSVCVTLRNNESVVRRRFVFV